MEFQIRRLTAILALLLIVTIPVMGAVSVKASCCAGESHCGQQVCKIAKRSSAAPAHATSPRQTAPQRALVVQQTNIARTLFVARAAATIIRMSERDRASQGSLRCDRDIGLHTLLDTFLI